MRDVTNSAKPLAFIERYSECICVHSRVKNIDMLVRLLCLLCPFIVMSKVVCLQTTILSSRDKLVWNPALNKNVHAVVFEFRYLWSMSWVWRHSFYYQVGCVTSHSIIKDKYKSLPLTIFFGVFLGIDFMLCVVRTLKAGVTNSQLRKLMYGLRKKASRILPGSEELIRLERSTSSCAL